VVGKWNNEEDYEIMIAKKKKSNNSGRKIDMKCEMEQNVFFTKSENPILMITVGRNKNENSLCQPSCLHYKFSRPLAKKTPTQIELHVPNKLSKQPDYKCKTFW
jgi:hypothetical protein